MRSEMRGIALLLLVFFVTDLQAVKADAKAPASAEQASVEQASAEQASAEQAQVLLAPQPQNQAKPPARKPDTSLVAAQEVAPNSPVPANDADSGATLTNLPAAKRLAISIGAGMLTLLLALWIGARRD